MNSHIRNSGVSQINGLRKLLWEGIYSNIYNMQSFVNHIRQSFIPGTIGDVDFDFNKSIVNIRCNGRPFEYNDANDRISSAYKGFIQDMFITGKINQDDYNACINNTNMLYFVTFKDSHNLRIGL
jgi:hypothetical protein